VIKMKTVTVRLPERLVADIEAESRDRRVSKSDVIRERLERGANQQHPDPLASIRDLIGSVDHGPPDLSARKKHYLRAWGFGRKHPPR
jgi:Arc/MetJ-type ribon-helix-helix transcriptional regulator